MRLILGANQKYVLNHHRHHLYLTVPLYQYLEKFLRHHQFHMGNLHLQLRDQYHHHDLNLRHHLRNLMRILKYRLVLRLQQHLEVH